MDKKARDDLTEKEIKASLKKIVKQKIDENVRLRAFLQKKKIYGAFVRNAVGKELRIRTTNSTRGTLVRELSILNSFRWGDTKEGWEYWNAKNIEFEKFCEACNNGVYKDSISTKSGISLRI